MYIYRYCSVHIQVLQCTIQILQCTYTETAECIYRNCRVHIHVLQCTYTGTIQWTYTYMGTVEHTYRYHSVHTQVLRYTYTGTIQCTYTYIGTADHIYRYYSGHIQVTQCTYTGSSVYIHRYCGMHIQFTLQVHTIYELYIYNKVYKIYKTLHIHTHANNGRKVLNLESDTQYWMWSRSFVDTNIFVSLHFILFSEFMNWNIPKCKDPQKETWEFRWTVLMYTVNCKL